MLIGLGNLFACYWLFRGSSPKLQIFLFLLIPITGLLLAFFSLFGSGRKVSTAIGIFLNLIPLVFVLLILWAFSDGTGFGGWR